MNLLWMDKTWMMENNCLGLSSIYIWIVKPVIKRNKLRKGNDWIKLYNNRLGDKITYLMIKKLLNINRYILEKIHLSTDHYCRYVDTTLFTFWLEYNPDDNI